MANIYIKRPVEEVLQNICARENLNLTDFVNEILETRIKEGKPSIKEEDNKPTIEDLILQLLQFTPREQKRFLALYDQFTCDIKGQLQMLERLKKA